MDKITLESFTSNSRKLSRQKFHNYLACEFTAYSACRNTEMNLKFTTIYQRIKLSNNKFINGIVRLIWTDCKMCQKSNHDRLGAGWMNCPLEAIVRLGASTTTFMCDHAS